MTRPARRTHAEDGHRPGDDAIAAALRAQPRERFLPEPFRAYAHLDRPLDIGFGQTNSQPSTVAAMLRLLDVRRGDRVLDVGAGSGWTTALLAHLTGQQGEVVGVELVPQLAAWGARNVAASGQPWARLVAATPGVLGLPEHAPFDRILVSAEAQELPRALVDQLADDGRMVVPVAGQMCLVQRVGDAVRVTGHGEYRFVPLR